MSNLTLSIALQTIHMRAAILAKPYLTPSDGRDLDQLEATIDAYLQDASDQENAAMSAALDDPDFASKPMPALETAMPSAAPLQFSSVQQSSTRIANTGMTVQEAKDCAKHLNSPQARAERAKMRNDPSVIARILGRFSGRVIGAPIEILESWLPDREA